MSDYLLNRESYWYYFRRVPAHYARFDKRKHISVSLKTQDEAIARERAAAQSQTLETYWQSLVRHKKVHGQDQSWQAAVEMARAHGFRYVPVEELQDTRLDDLLQRIHTAKGSSSGKIQKKTVQGLLGTAGRPRISVTSGADTFFALTADRLVGKSEDFIRKWKNPRRRAVNNFSSACGEVYVGETTRRNILDFRAWWVDRVMEEGHNPSTANKDFTHLKDVLRVLARENEIDLDIPVLFSEISLKGQENSRAPFEAAFVQKTILPGLGGLNAEAQALVMLMADTGAGVSEIVGLEAEDISLSGKIPFIDIRPNKKRTLKNKARPRQIPLVGSALEGAKLVPKGFKRYDNADAASALVNQYFANNGMKPSPAHTLYSLRHTFKDRLRDVDAPDEIKDELMGHASDRPKYGRGNKLETKLKWLKKIAFKV